MKPVHVGVAVLTLGCACLAVAAMAQNAGPKADARKPGSEPPTEYVLDIDGQKVDLLEGTAAKVKVGDKTVSATVRRKEDKLFSEGGVSFRYPAHLAYERDAETEGIVIWTFDGNDSIIGVNQLSAKMSPRQFARQIADGMSAALKAPPASTAAVTLQLEGKAVEGTRYTFKIGAVAITYEIYPLQSAGKATTVLTIQDTPKEDGTMTEETSKIRQLLSKTFSYVVAN